MRGLTSIPTADRIKEMLLAFWCLRLVIRNGGVLEQPAYSRLWSAASLPRPGDTTSAPALWSIAVDQSNFGHRTTKPTWLLFAGVDPKALLFDCWSIANVDTTKLADLTPGQRSYTPAGFAAFLIAAAKQSHRARRGVAYPWNLPQQPVRPAPEKTPINQTRRLFPSGID